MKTRTLWLLAVAASAASAPCFARQLSPAEALDRAMPDVRHLSSTASRMEAADLRLTIDNEGTPTVYLFATPDGGFLVLPADDAVEAKVLGYGDSFAEEAAGMPPAMNWWLSQYSAEIGSMISAQALPPRDEEPGVGVVDEPEIEPLVKTLWNQTSPYNAFTPTVNGENCPTGCVATAMAQVMKVWNYPEHGTGSNSYYPGGYISGELSADFSSISFDWNAMTDTYSPESTPESEEAVATLMSACGIAVNMDYGPNSSGSNYQLASLALVKYFGYDKSLRDLSRNYFGIEEWTRIIYDELKEGRPVLYSGRNDEGGHAFVCDGYRPDGYFHFNWGWGGYSNGYFLVTALNPTDQGVGGSVGGYNISQTIVVGIRPAVEGSGYVPVIQFMSDFEVADDTYTRMEGESVTFYDTGAIYNASLSDLTIVPGVKLTDEQGNATYVASSSPVELKRYGTFRNFTVGIEAFPQSGTYTVTPAVRRADSQEWVDALVRLENIREYILTATPEQLTFSLVAEPTLVQTNLKLNTSLYPGQTCSITATLTNNTTEEYYGSVTPALLTNNYEMAQAESIEVDLLGGQSQDLEWLCTFPANVAPGNYRLALIDKDTHRIGRCIPVTVKEAPEVAAEPYVAGVTICGQNAMGTTADSPVKVDLSHFTTTMTVGCHAGYYGQVVNGAVWFSEARGVVGLGGRFIGVDAGDTADITVEHDLSWLEKDHSYLLYVKGEQSGAIGAPVYFKADPSSGIEVIDHPEAFTVYTDGTVMHVGSPTPIVRVEVFDLRGYRMIDTESTDVDISHLTPGVYVVAGTDSGGDVRHAKLRK